MRIRKIKGFTEDKKGDHTDDLIEEQDKKIKELMEDNIKLKNQLKKCKEFENEVNRMRNRLFELESKNTMLKKRLKTYNNEPIKNIVTKDNTENINNNELKTFPELSDEEDFEKIQDEGMRKAFKENKEKIDDLRKGVRLLFAKSTPGIVDIRKKKMGKEAKEGTYDYSENIN